MNMQVTPSRYPLCALFTFSSRLWRPSGLYYQSPAAPVPMDLPGGGTSYILRGSLPAVVIMPRHAHGGGVLCRAGANLNMPSLPRHAVACAVLDTAHHRAPGAYRCSGAHWTACLIDLFTSAARHPPAFDVCACLS